MPAIVPPFEFSQSGLQDFDRCRRLFFLRHIERLEWPATSASRMWELNLRARRRFHLLLHQHYLGVDVTPMIEAEPANSPVHQWWEAFLQFPLALSVGPVYPEVTLSAPIGEHRIVARLDLLSVEPRQRALIVDWKTGRRPPSPQELHDRWQTIVYQYALVVAGAPYFGGDPPPESISMIYWFADFPASPITLDYDHRRHEMAHQRIAEKIAEISGLSASEFTLCDDERTCRYCAYQSYCHRGEGLDADTVVDDTILEEEEWDWSDVPEYEY